MNLKANASNPELLDGERGYAMAALLVAMGVLAVLMTVAMPTWKQTVRREQEEELIFRGNQYSRAIGAYQRAHGNASPPTLDELVTLHLLRKKYKDPLAPTKDGEFAPLYVGQGPTGPSNPTGSSASPGPAVPAGRGGGTPPTSTTATLASTVPSGPIIGVASKNTGESLRTYNDHNHYNEWQFIPLQQSRTGGTGGADQGPERGGRGFGLPGVGRQGGPGTPGADGRGSGPLSIRRNQDGSLVITNPDGTTTTMTRPAERGGAQPQGR